MIETLRGVADWPAWIQAIGSLVGLGIAVAAIIQPNVSEGRRRREADRRIHAAAAQAAVISFTAVATLRLRVWSARLATLAGAPGDLSGNDPDDHVADALLELDRIPRWEFDNHGVAGQLAVIKAAIRDAKGRFDDVRIRWQNNPAAHVEDWEIEAMDECLISIRDAANLVLAEANEAGNQFNMLRDDSLPEGCGPGAVVGGQSEAPDADTEREPSLR